MHLSKGTAKLAREVAQGVYCFTMHDDREKLKRCQEPFQRVLIY